jgi:hypothetical protein
MADMTLEGSESVLDATGTGQAQYVSRPLSTYPSKEHPSQPISTPARIITYLEEHQLERTYFASRDI